MKSLLIVSILLIAATAFADSGVQWQFQSDGKPVDYNPNGFTVKGIDISCAVDPVENMMPGQRHHITCWFSRGGKVIVDRNLHCDRNQIEDYIEVDQFYFGCKQ